MPKDLIIVESPTKAKTIAKFLGKDFEVLSSYGHIRDLPKGKLGIDIDNDFSPQYVTPRDKMKTVTQLKNNAAKAKTIYFATDEDREGEAIAWHLAYLLDIQPHSSQRIVFHEITDEAIHEALKSPRHIDQKLVNAQQARRILDRLVGYKLSPFLWKKVARGLSAGRVQSVAVRLVVEREREIAAFVPQEYWTIEAELKGKNGNFLARVFKHETKTLDKFAIPDERSAQGIVDVLKKSSFTIANLEEKETKKNPYPPFTTSSLQQAANRLLGFSAKRTMVLAQQLYEGVKLGHRGETGLITYMRTDSLNLAEKFLGESHAYINEKFGSKYAARRTYKTTSKGAQEAHEAIRPTDVRLDPESVKAHLNPAQLKLYELIWKRSLASQMSAARLQQTVIDVAAGAYTLRASGSVIAFPGWLSIYPDKIQENQLPKLSPAEQLQLLKLDPQQHFTQPPARYSEAGLVKALEERGIGRPSTYAPTIATITARGYVELTEKRLKPTDIGVVVNDLLTEHFPKVVDYDFTAHMEKELDDIAAGEQEWQPIVREFYEPFAEKLSEKEQTVSKSEVMAARELGIDPVTHKPVSARRGRFGPFVQLGTKDDEEKPKFASLAKDQTPETITLAEALRLLSLPRTIGQDDQDNDITVGIGRFGPYLKVNGGYISIKNEDPYTIDLTTARTYIKEHQEKLKQKTIKEFPDSNIRILNGRYGAYITNGEKNARLPKGTSAEELSQTECEELLAASTSKKRGSRKKKS